MTLVKCNLPSCQHEFEPRKGKIYCSNTCRSKASIIKNAGLGNLVPAQKEKENEPTRKPMQVDSPVLSQLPVHAQFIIDQLKKETQRWETDFKEEREARKKLKEENRDLRNQLAEMKTEQKIKAIEEEHKKPGALEGILDSPLGQHLGPALGKLAERFVDAIPMNAGAATLTQVAGVSGEQNEQVTQISNWYIAQPAEVQEVFYKLVNDMAGKQPDELKIKMKYIKNLLNYGTTATGTNG